MGFEGARVVSRRREKLVRLQGFAGVQVYIGVFFAHSDTKSPRFPLTRYRTAYFCMSMSRVQSWIIRRTLKSRERD